MDQWLALAQGHELCGSIKCEEFLDSETVNVLRTPLYGVPRLRDTYVFIKLATALSHGGVNITFTRWSTASLWFPRIPPHLICSCILWS